MSGVFQQVTKGWQLGLQCLSPLAGPERLRARRRLALAANKLFRSEMTFERNGFKWTGLTTCSITQEIFLNDHYQDADLGYLLGKIATGVTADRPVIVNVGANLGDLALPLSRSGKRVIAIEPNPATFARLEHNVRQNGLTGRITCAAAAIATTAGVAELVVPADPGNSELSAGGDRLGFDGVDRRQNVVQVRTVPLDDLLLSLNVQPGDVALVCSDTQGFETQIIASGSALWASGTPLWV